MKDLFKKVGEFHKAFKVEENTVFDVSEKAIQLRHDLALEELNETIEAVKNKDVVEALDGLADQLYILVGTARKFGFTSDNLIDAFNEVQLSNMSKLDENGEPIFREDGKVLKGKNYFKPNIKEVLNG